MIIKNVTFYRLKIPLNKPYHLSFKSVYFYESILVKVITQQGQEAWGESTPLPGYSKATIKESYEFTEEYSKEILNKSLKTARMLLLEKGLRFPFASSALLCAVDELILKQESFWRNISGLSGKFSVPLVGLVSGNDFGKIGQNVDSLLSQGYQSLKVKVAIPPVDIEKDIHKLKVIREISGKKINIRVDANQGYSTKQALAFLSKSQDLSLQLFEQPIPVCSWNNMKLLFLNKGNVPIMLDEDILSIKEVYLAKQFQCADYIKLKVMKQGGLMETLNIAKTAQKLGFKVIIGNGVQTEIGCMQENILHHLIDPTLAGEQNGFLKQKTSYLEKSIPFNNGRAELGFISPHLDKIKHFIYK